MYFLPLGLPFDALVSRIRSETSSATSASEMHPAVSSASTPSRIHPRRTKSFRRQTRHLAVVLTLTNVGMTTN